MAGLAEGGVIAVAGVAVAALRGVVAIAAAAAAFLLLAVEALQGAAAASFGVTIITAILEKATTAISSEKAGGRYGWMRL